MEFILGLFDFIVEWFSGIWDNIFATPLLELRYSQVIVLIIITYASLKALGIVGKSAHKGSVAAAKAVGSAALYISPRGRASRTVCIHCGRTLDKCVCQSNKGLSFSKRLRKQGLELKLRKAASK